ncbi:Rossmann-like domain-containing protein [Corynebacterium kutscheri]|uniref:Rossmann-like domain-containing protein n=1 Tax=Corynebacterium kutscheri TaxID=35755 RepID=UPI0037C08951
MWEIYDRLIADIDPKVQVVSTKTAEPVAEVVSSESSVGRAFLLPSDSRPATLMAEEMVGRPLKDVAQLAKSWNFTEAAFGMAAINAWWGARHRVVENGFELMESTSFEELFNPYAELVAGKTVGIVGHFPFAYRALAGAGEIKIFERNLRPGDYPDSASEYLLPECDYVFITGSAFVNKTMPRLLELSKDAFTVVVGPSASCAPFLLEYGVNDLLGFSSTPEPEPEANGLDLFIAHGTWHGRRVKLSA